MISFGHAYTLLSEVDSTSNYIAKYLESADLADGTAILTYRQTQGRGQRERLWQMMPAKDLAVSYYLKPKFSFEDIFAFNKVVTLALAEVISRLAQVEAKVKWPNDILIEGRKVAGVLIEPTWAEARCKHIILGIGVNVNSTGGEIFHGATSLAEKLNSELDLFEVFKVISEGLSLRCRAWHNGTLWVKSEYANRLYGRGQKVRYQLDGKVSSARIVQVDESGRLVLDTDEGLLELLHGQAQIDYSGVIG